MSIRGSILSGPTKGDLSHRQNPLQGRLSVSPIRFRRSFQSTTSPTRHCAFEHNATLQKLLHTSNWIVYGAIGVIASARSLLQLTTCLLSSKSSWRRQHQG